MKKIITMVGTALMCAVAFGNCPNSISQEFTVGQNQQMFTLTFVNHNISGGQTTVSYELTSIPTGTTISHITIELCPPLRSAFVGGTFNGSAVNVNIGPDPTTGLNGLKVEEAQNGIYEFTFSGSWSLGCSTAALKQGNATAPTQQAIVGLNCGSGPGDNSIGGYKWYDVNTNGVIDTGETVLVGWEISVTINDGTGQYTFTALTDENGFWSAEGEQGWTYMVHELMPSQTNWVQTFPLNNLYQGVFEGQTHDLNFGNVGIGAGGGHTLGFWSNKNGQGLIESDDLLMLRGLNLRNANGTDFDPTTKVQVKNWLLAGTATNMANMLSVQLAAMSLNVHNGKVDGNALVYAPGANSANLAGFATVNALMAEANTELGLHGMTLAGSPDRPYQEMLKSALDNANNNITFVLLTPPPYEFE